MKKKLLFLSMIALLLCVFAISVSAQGINKFATDEFQTGDNITYLEGINEDMYLKQDGKNNSFYELVDPEFTARAVLKNSDGTYTTYPSWYFIDYYHYWNGAEYSYTVERINALSDVTGETYTLDSVIRYEYPEYKKNHGFSLKYYASFGFINAVYVRVPSHATSVSFRNSRSLIEIEYAPGTNVTSVSDKAFVDCHSIEVIRFPNTATSMGSEIVCFWSTNISTASLKEVYLGANMASMGTKNPLNTANIDGLKIYVPATINGSTYTFSTHFPQKSMLIFTGTKEQAEAFGATKTISYEEYANTGFAHEAGTIVYGYNVCDAFYEGKHVEKNDDNNPCILADCENCNAENLCIGDESTHIKATTIVYETYDKAGSKIVYCINKGCNHKITEDTQALFTCLGYSVSEIGKGGILMSFAVNNKAINTYADITDNKVNYGVFAGLKDKLGSGDAVSTEGIAQNGAIVADYTAKGFDIIEIKVSGVSAEEYKDTQIALGVYVIVNKGEETTISYLQDKAPLDNEKYVSRSYNQLIG